LSNPERYWMGFNLVKGIGAVRFKMLLDVFGDLETAWNASPEALKATGLGRKQIENLLPLRASVNLEQLWQQIQAQKIKVLTWQSADYPRRIKEIEQAPPVLYLRGELLPEDEWAVAVVGTRRITAYGRQVAEEIARGLAQSGVTVVSGLARGVDAIAHFSALEAGGRTLAVLGNGVDRIYPPENRKLAENIISAGALISDYPPGTPPDAANFPPRNRIISGLSMAVVVVEAGERSGALITAAFAADQGRDVFAVPGSIHAPQSVGANRLVQQGARPFLGVSDLLQTLNLTRVAEQSQVRKTLPADANESRLLDVLCDQPLHVDELSQQMGMPISALTAALVMMELKGMVKQVGSMQYIALHEAKSEYITDGLE